MKTAAGKPGISAINRHRIAAGASTLGLLPICCTIAGPRLPSRLSSVVRVTSRPAAMALNSAGICATRPSPMVRIEKTCIASPASIPCEKTPTARPPTRLISTMTMEAMASPFTNFIAPSRLPCSLLSSSSVRRRSRASSLPISPDRRSLSIDNCLPGIASRLNRAATSATRSAPFEMTMNCTTVMIRKTTSPTIRLPPATISPNCWMMCPPSAVVRTCAWSRSKATGETASKAAAPWERWRNRAAW